MNQIGKWRALLAKRPIWYLVPPRSEWWWRWGRSAFNGLWRAPLRRRMYVARVTKYGIPFEGAEKMHQRLLEQIVDRYQDSGQRHSKELR